MYKYWLKRAKVKDFSSADFCQKKENSTYFNLINVKVEMIDNFISFVKNRMVHMQPLLLFFVVCFEKHNDLAQNLK